MLKYVCLLCQRSKTFFYYFTKWLADKRSIKRNLPRNTAAFLNSLTQTSGEAEESIGQFLVRL